MVKIWKASLIYAIMGLFFGVYYREIGKVFNYEGVTVLSTLHVHTLVLGMMMALVVLALEKTFSLTKQAQFKSSWSMYRSGVDSLLTMLLVRGTLEVSGITLTSAVDASIAGIAGLAHIFLAIGIIRLILVIGKAVKAAESSLTQ